jgi:hypothetical protein
MAFLAYVLLEEFLEMTSVFRYVFLVAILVSAPLRSHADILVSVAPVNSGPIVQGSTAVFDVFARSNTGNQAFGYFAFDLIVTTPAGTPLTDARGGRFTNPATNLLGGFGWFQFDPIVPIAKFDGQSSGSIPSFGDTNTRVGTVTLATAGATPGNYLMDFREVTTLTSGFQRITSSGSPTSFTITAVPEPSSMALLCVAGAAAWVYRRRARRN